MSETTHVRLIFSFFPYFLLRQRQNKCGEKTAADEKTKQDKKPNEPLVYDKLPAGERQQITIT